MANTDTLQKSNLRSTLEELLAQSKTQADRPTVQHRRRAEDKARTADQNIDRSDASRVVLAPVVRLPYDISYACLLIPKFSAHYLIGDIAESLREWMQQICLSFEWR